MRKPVIALTVLFAALTVAVAQTADKVATVDLETVIRLHPETPNNLKTLEDLYKKFERQSEVERAKLEKLQENFKEANDRANDPALSEKVRETNLNIAKEILGDLRKQDEEFRATNVKLQRNLSETEMNLFETTMKEVGAKLEKIAKAKGITLVVNSSVGRMGTPMPVVLYSANTIDLTEELVKAVGGKLDSGTSTNKAVTPAKPADNKKR